MALIRVHLGVKKQKAEASKTSEKTAGLAPHRPSSPGLRCSNLTPEIPPGQKLSAARQPQPVDPFLPSPTGTDTESLICRNSALSGPPLFSTSPRSASKHRIVHLVVRVPPIWQGRCIRSVRHSRCYAAWLTHACWPSPLQRFFGGVFFWSVAASPHQLILPTAPALPGKLQPNGVHPPVRLRAVN